MKYAALSLLLLATVCNAEWKVKTSKDDLTGTAETVAVSDFVDATRPLSFPYQGTKMRLIAQCRGDKVVTYLHFTKTPNLSNSTTERGRNEAIILYKFSNADVSFMTFEQAWGEPFVLPGRRIDLTEWTSGLKSANSLKVQVGWHGVGDPVWEVSLAGSTNAINQVERSCR